MFLVETEQRFFKMWKNNNYDPKCERWFVRYACFLALGKILRKNNRTHLINCCKVNAALMRKRELQDKAARAYMPQEIKIERRVLYFAYVAFVFFNYYLENPFNININK